MTDDLINRARFDRRGTRTEYDLLFALDRNPTTINAGADICAEAKSTILAQADRIEELEAKLAKAVTELRKLGEAAKENAYGPYHIVCHGCSDTHHAVDAIIAELTGGKDD